MNSFLGKIIFAGFFVFAGLVNAQDASSTEALLDGDWRYTSPHGAGEKPYSSFVIKLHSEATGRILGSYCFITQTGGKIDCDPEGKEKNLEGVVSADGQHARIRFYSFFGAKNGIAEISLSDGKLFWKIEKYPDGDSFYGPDNVMLGRDKGGVRNKYVVIDRAYLYTDPKDTAATRAYLVKNDRVELLSISDNLKYWKIRYTQENGHMIERWVACDAVNSCP
jgi:hypothetical protein